MILKKKTNGVHHRSEMGRYALSAGCLVLAMLIINGYIGVSVIKQSRQLHEASLDRAERIIHMVRELGLARFHLTAQAEHRLNAFLLSGQPEQVRSHIDGFLEEERKVRRHLTSSVNIARQLAVPYTDPDKLLRDHRTYGELYTEALGDHVRLPAEVSPETVHAIEALEKELMQDMEKTVEAYHHKIPLLFEAMKDEIEASYTALEALMIGVAVIALVFVLIMIFIALTRKTSPA